MDVFRGSQELAAVLAAVATGAGAEVSGTCSRLVSVNSSLEGVMVTSGSSTIGVSTGVSTLTSTCAGSGMGSSGSVVGGSIGSSGLTGSTGLKEKLVQIVIKVTIIILFNWLWCLLGNRCSRKHACPTLLHAVGNNARGNCCYDSICRSNSRSPAIFTSRWLYF